jgi:hypothetical protein
MTLYDTDLYELVLTIVRKGFIKKIPHSDTVIKDYFYYIRFPANNIMSSLVSGETRSVLKILCYYPSTRSFVYVGVIMCHRMEIFI